MKKMSVTVRICILGTFALTLLSVILRTVAMFVCFDREVGYFNVSLLNTLLVILSFLGAGLPILLSPVTPKGRLPAVWQQPRRNLAPLLPAVLFLLSGILTMSVVLSDGLPLQLALTVGILALLSSLCYFLHTDAKFKNALHVIGYAPILWGLMSVAETYTDQMTTMNSPIKLGLQFGFLGLMLMTTAELRFLMNKPAPRAALCFHCLALFFCLNGSIPTLVAFASGILTRPLHGAYALALLGAGLYAAFRIIFYVSCPLPAEEEWAVQKANQASPQAKETSPKATDTETNAIPAVDVPDHNTEE